MNRPTLVSRIDAPHSAPARLLDVERDARRLRAQYVHDMVATLAIDLDLRVRRVAYRVAAALGGRATCRS